MIALLPVDTEAKDGTLGHKAADFLIGEINDSVGLVLRAVGAANLGGIGNQGMEPVAFAIKVAPDNPLLMGRIDQLCRSLTALFKGIAPCVAALGESEGLENRFIAIHHNFMDMQGRKIVPLIGIAKGSRVIHEHSPGSHPLPIQILCMALQAPLGRLTAIMDEEHRQHFSTGHNTQKF